jgi:hypothetical protein
MNVIAYAIQSQDKFNPQRQNKKNIKLEWILKNSNEFFKIHIYLIKKLPHQMKGELKNFLQLFRY